MRRYRFGLVAMPVAVAYVALVAGLGVFALVTGEVSPLWFAVVRSGVSGPAASPGIVLLLVLVGAVQGWVYWQVLRGRRRDARPSPDRRIALLRAVLYAGIALSLPPFSLLYSWDEPVGTGALVTLLLVQGAMVWLFSVAVGGALPAWARILMLVLGTADVVAGLGLTLSQALLFKPGMIFFDIALLGGVPGVAWLALLLTAQAQDPRWSRATVAMGVLSLVTSFVRPTSFASSDATPLEVLSFWLLLALGIVGLGWQARSAHELAGPPASPFGPRRPPARIPARPWWPVASAVVLPLVPAAVNLASGMPFWIGPRGAVEQVVAGGAVSVPAALAWLGLDLLAGVGGVALVVLVAVLRGTVRLVRATVAALVVLAAVGVVSALTAAPPGPSSGDLGLYPDGLFATGPADEPSFGLSPLWFSAAFLASAVVLTLLVVRTDSRP
ncbi:hypothetical protein [Nonomuraea sp. NPDC005692]|uniref:hypothetical protein n=1 Tax=Nonomuraea sp. NPDC005692 TaxID=3157168 RepID=UPI0033F37A63